MTKSTKRVSYSKQFQKQLKKAPTEIKAAFLKRRYQFQQNPFSPQLNNHKLSGRLGGFRSVNITGDWRAIYSENSEAITFEIIGTHSDLYK